MCVQPNVGVNARSSDVSRLNSIDESCERPKMTLKFTSKLTLYMASGASLGSAFLAVLVIQCPGKLR